MNIYYLYVKTHRITGLQYLGYTSKSDPYSYHGSGKRWNLHLKKHGYNFDTKILHRCVSKTSIRAWGLFYSKLWSIVDSNKWANLKDESGDGGGCFGATNGMYGKTHTIIVRKKLAQIPVKYLKGKTYEEIYGEEKAKKLRNLRSVSMKGKDNSGYKNPRYDSKNYYFMNTITGQILFCNRTEFMALYPEMKKSSVCEMINKAIDYKNWCVLYSL